MRARRRLSFLTALILLVAAVPRAGAEDSASPYVRILLSGLKLTDRADMTLEGRYEADAGNGARIACPGGAAVTVQIREGSLILFCQGLAMDAGKSLTLRRVSRDGSGGGIRFSHKGNLFPGDLTLTVSGGQLRPVLRLTVEEYLPGVVPYEMSDSYPAEALKAQAVCARTYAIRHIRTDRDYDMTDTTSDQVYRGTGGGNTNAARAILETAGVVVTVNGTSVPAYAVGSRQRGRAAARSAAVSCTHMSMRSS